MKKVKETAKTAALTAFKVPQQIGRTILSVPDNVSKLTKNKKEQSSSTATNATSSDKFANDIEYICQEILADQSRRKMVRDSKGDCLNEIVSHLGSFLVENPNATYEEWVKAVHPDNALFVDGSIDHRFYVEDSDHRLLWNACMVEFKHPERVVEVRSFSGKFVKRI